MRDYDHELKVWPDYFDSVARGDKSFDLRFDDRDFEVGQRVCCFA